MLLYLFVVLLPYILGVMTSNRPQAMIYEMKSFVVLLDLSAYDTARVFDILKDNREVLSFGVNENGEGGSLGKLVDLSCKVAQVVFKEKALVEKKIIENTVSESW